MTVDISTIAEPERELIHREIGAGPARAARMRREFDAPIADVWNACTDPQRLERWFLPVSGDLRRGGSFNIAGVAGGEIVRCEPPHLVAVTWIHEDWAADEVELRLTALGPDRTELEIEHATINTTNEFRGKLVDAITNMGGGWEPCLVSLDMYLHGDQQGEFSMASFRERPEIAAVAIRANEAWQELNQRG